MRCLVSNWDISVPSQVNRPVDRLGRRSSPYLAFAGLAFSLSTATQWRSSAGIGPGEALLGLVSIFALFSFFFKGHIEKAPLRRSQFYISFVIGILLISPVGFFYASYLGVDHDLWLRQYLFIGLTALLPFILYSAFGTRGFLKILLWHSIFTTSILLFLLLYAWLFSPLFLGAELWYGGRFRGWSINPNQTSLAVALIPFSLVILFRIGMLKLWVAATLFSAAIAVGLATNSNALLVSWVLGLGLLFLPGSKLNKSRYLNQRVGRAKRRGPRIGRLVALGLGAGLMVLGAIWLASNWGALYSGRIAGGSAGQGSVRVELWLQGIAAWAHSPLFGLGPGHFSGMGGPFQGKEAHNLYVDWLASYGLTGLLGLLALFSVVALRSMQKRQFDVFGMIFVLAAISFFHFYARHPVFWFFLLTPFVLLSMERGGSVNKRKLNYQRRTTMRQFLSESR